jgi:hypothetical protein
VSEKESQKKGDEAPPHFVVQILVGFRAAIPSPNFWIASFKEEKRN